MLENLLLLRHHCPRGVSSLTILHGEKNKTKTYYSLHLLSAEVSQVHCRTAGLSRTCERLWLYLCSGGGRLQQPLLLPQAAGHDAGDLHGLLQVLALEVLLDPAQVMLIEDVVLLQEAAVLLVYFAQEVVEDQRGV